MEEVVTPLDIETLMSDVWIDVAVKVGIVKVVSEV